MIGIQDIGTYIPDQRISNYDRKEEFAIDDLFIEERLGVLQVARKPVDMPTSDLASAAFGDLQHRTGLRPEDVQCLIVVTQNPDYNLPHTSAILHGKLGLAPACACFDISLGCSGFVYGLSVIESFMTANGMTCGVLVTADPYSAVINADDKNTSLLFGDAATATLISDQPRFRTGKFTFGTLGDKYAELICTNGQLAMNGRAIFDFAARQVPPDVKHLLAVNNLDVADVDKFLFHQGSKYMLRTIVGRLGIEPAKAEFAAGQYGNTVSSSIPLLLAPELDVDDVVTVVISGFGVGLSWSSGVLHRVK